MASTSAKRLGYSANILSWVEAGGVYAVAGLRGGSEEGEEWHRAGMLDRKQNVFDDFHAAAEYLIAEGITSRSRLAVWGGSNGGLLVGAAVTQRPDLFAAAVCSAPLLDMVRYERFKIGETWNVEYGSAAKPEELGWLLGYSPYHRVRDGVEYPAVLLTVFSNDTRVDPLHGYKMCAALQHATASGRPCCCAPRDRWATGSARYRLPPRWPETAWPSSHARPACKSSPIKARRTSAPGSAPATVWRAVGRRQAPPCGRSR